MLGVIGHAFVVVRVTAIEGQVYGPGIGSGIGQEGDVLLIKGIVAVIAQILGDSLPPFIQLVVIEQIARMDRKMR